MQFVYVKEAFMPALEEEVGMLFEVRLPAKTCA